MKIPASRAFATQTLMVLIFGIGSCGFLGFSIVSLRQKISFSANNTRLLEQSIAETERLIAAVAGAIAVEQSPETLDRRNRELALGLARPVESQVVRVGESAVARLAARRNAEIFAAEQGGVVAPVRFGQGGVSRP